jgi:hypothetical protein
LKLTGKYFFQTYFYPLDIFLLECEKDEKPQIHFKAPLIQNLKKCNISSTYNLHKGYKIDCDFAWIPMNLLKPTLNMYALFKALIKLKKMFILILELNNILS